VVRPSLYVQRFDAKFCLERSTFDWLVQAARADGLTTSYFLNKVLVELKEGKLLSPKHTELGVLIDSIFSRVVLDQENDDDASKKRGFKQLLLKSEVVQELPKAKSIDVIAGELFADDDDSEA
jgi:hypothetical protein